MGFLCENGRQARGGDLGFFPALLAIAAPIIQKNVKKLVARPARKAARAAAAAPAAPASPAVPIASTTPQVLVMRAAPMQGPGLLDQHGTAIAIAAGALVLLSLLRSR